MENVAAISTPAGNGGVAVIRISGDDPLSVARAMFVPSGECDFTPNVMYPGKISADSFFDYGYAVYFKAPRSFTGEDVVEFHCHGGAQVARAVLKKVISLGARYAEAGEFSRRAFLNGKLTLASAEGMIDMINADSGAMLRAGSMQYFGKLTEGVENIQSRLKDLLAAIAADIDYPEEDSDGLDLEKIKASAAETAGSLEGLAATFSVGRKIKDGVCVAICGAPNVGKSSLLNALLGYDKAIVSAAAGTTRDVVEGEIEIEGVKYVFYDTAGIRERAGEIEKIGIERAVRAVKSADLALYVTDDGKYIKEERQGNILKVFNKCDAVAPRGQYDVAVSAKTGEGIEGLKRAISAACVGPVAADKAYIVDGRHYEALTRAAASLKSAAEALSGGMPLHVASVDLREAWEALGEITGETASEEIINAVFSKFCVGK